HEARAQWQGIYHGEANEGIRGTRWGLVQASVEYLNHARRAHSEETRFRRAFLTQDRLMQDAMRVAQAVGLRDQRHPGVHSLPLGCRPRESLCHKCSAEPTWCCGVVVQENHKAGR